MRNTIIIFLLAGFISCIEQNNNITNPPVGPGSQQPAILTTDYGMVLSWMEPIDGDIHLRFSTFNGVIWSDPINIAQGSNWFVNWADFPALISNGDKLFAHFMQISGESTYDYDIMYTVSSDRGATWLPPRKLHADTIKGEHGFLSGSAFEDGFVVSWLDGRYTKTENGAMSIRGAVINGAGEVTRAMEIDNRTCDCCQTTLTNVGGKPMVFYRDRSENEVRDIYYSALLDSGWIEPQVLHDDNWEINACPVNGPVTLSNDDHVAVGWFTGAEANYEVKLKISADSGESFGEVILVDGPDAFGRLDIEIDEEHIYLTYLTRKELKASLMLAVYNMAGELVEKKSMATINPDRGTGFPRITAWSGRLVIAWTDLELNQVNLLAYSISGD